MNVKSRFARCEIFAVSPVSRLSIPITEYPRSTKVSARWEPMKPAAPVITTRCLVGMLVEEAPEQREPHDLQVEADRPVLDVVEVVLDPLLDRRVAAPAVDLRPAGQPRLHLVAKHVRGDAMLELFDEVRTLGPRADD